MLDVLPWLLFPCSGTVGVRSGRKDRSYQPLRSARVWDRVGISVPPGKAEGGIVVDRVCFTLPLLEGKTEDARALLETQRKCAYAASERRINITKEVWYAQQTPPGDLLRACIESPDFADALGMFRSPNTSSTGGSSELLSSYEA